MGKKMRIGYACLAIAVPGTGIRSCTLKNTDETRLTALIEQNLRSLENMIDYNIKNGIKLFRISSDLIPFGSSVAASLAWEALFRDRLTEIGAKIREAGMRVSMHPGQYTVLNSPDSAVARRAVDDLHYHGRVLHSLGLNPSHKIILHLGGAYGDKKQAVLRFRSGCGELNPDIRRRLVLENDDSLYHIADVLGTAAAVGLPVVYDNLHNAINPADAQKADSYWIGECARTWRESDGAQKVHYSQQHPDRKPGAHSQTVMIDTFLDFAAQLGDLKPDIMLEVKDKNLSAIKCMLCLGDRGVGALESEWVRYKYSVLERSPLAYQEIRSLLRDKGGYPAIPFYRLVEEALRQPEDTGHAVDALQHVWGYFKNIATEKESRDFFEHLEAYRQGNTTLDALKRQLCRLAEKYRIDYLLCAYYFYMDKLGLA